MPVEKLVTQEVVVEVEKVVVQERIVEVPVERVVVQYKEVPVEKEVIVEKVDSSCHKSFKKECSYPLSFSAFRKWSGSVTAVRTVCLEQVVLKEVEVPVEIKVPVPVEKVIRVCIGRGTVENLVRIIAG